MLAFLLNLAHGESKQKSEWATSSSNRKLAEVRSGSGGLLRHPHPAWLDVVGRTKNEQGRVIKDGTFKPFPGVKQTMTKLLELAEQNDGAASIAQYLNRHAVWKPKSGWTDAYVKKCWKNRALIGEHQPIKRVIVKEKGEEVEKFVPDGEPFLYYPPVVDRGLFLRVQQILNGRKGTSSGGRNSAALNIFQGLVKCAYCGGPMYHKPRSKKEGGRASLFCYYGMNGRSKCNCHSIAYQECVDTVLSQCGRIRPEQVVPNKGARAKLAASISQRLQRKVALAQETESEIANLMKRIAKVDDEKLQQRFEKEVSKREAVLVTLNAEIAGDSQDLAIAEHPIKDFSEWQSGITKLRKSLDQPETRRRLTAHLAEFIDRIEVFTKGYGPDHDDDFSEWYGDMEYESRIKWRTFSVTLRGKKRQQHIDRLAAAGVSAKKLAKLKSQSSITMDVDRPFVAHAKMTKREREERQAFLDWVLAKRATKYGRFLRLWFKQLKPREDVQSMYDLGGPGYIDIPVVGSIAGQPDLLMLWEQFRDETGLSDLPSKHAAASVSPNTNGSNGHFGRGAKERNASRSDRNRVLG
jgi:hypothetical protein